MLMEKYFARLPVSIWDNLTSLYCKLSLSIYLRVPHSGTQPTKKWRGYYKLAIPKAKRSKKWGAYRKYSAEEKTIKIVLCSIFWQVFHCKADRISIVNVGTVPLAIQFVFDAWVPYLLYQDVPCVTQLKVIAIASSPITTGNRSSFCLSLSPSSGG